MIPLREKFNVHCYDSCTLADIDLKPYAQEALHGQFVQGGIERAVAALLSSEISQPPPIILAFSIGGTIAWRAIQAGLPCRYFCAVSATRLRKEEPLFPYPGHLIYGKQDTYRPKSDWINRQSTLTTTLIAGKDHSLYQEKEYAEKIVSHLVKLCMQ